MVSCSEPFQVISASGWRFFSNLNIKRRKTSDCVVSSIRFAVAAILSNPFDVAVLRNIIFNPTSSPSQRKNRLPEEDEDLV